MILTCPSCSSRYRADPAAFGEGSRKVRCSNCGHVWRAAAPDDLPRRLDAVPPDAGAEGGVAAGSEPVTGLDPERRSPLRRPGARPLPPPPANRSSRLGWVVLIGVVLILFAALAMARDAVVRAWPPAGQLYAAIGMGPSMPGDGLRIAIAGHERNEAGSRVVLVVRGEVTNVSGDVRTVPRMEAVLRDAEGRELARWVFTAAQRRLLPGEISPFVTQIENPAQEAAALKIDFIADGR